MVDDEEPAVRAQRIAAESTAALVALRAKAATAAAEAEVGASLAEARLGMEGCAARLRERQSSLNQKVGVFGVVLCTLRRTLFRAASHLTPLPPPLQVGELDALRTQLRCVVEDGCRLVLSLEPGLAPLLERLMGEYSGGGTREVLALMEAFSTVLARVVEEHSQA